MNRRNGIVVNRAVCFLIVGLLLFGWLGIAFSGMQKQGAFAESATEKVYYENDFDDETTDSLLTEWSIAEGDGSASIVNGALELNGMSMKTTLLKYDALLPNENFTAEFDFSILDFTDTARWGGFAVKYNEGIGYWHASLRKNGNLNIDYWDDVEADWKVINGFTRHDGALNETVHVQISYSEEVLVYYVNGEYIAHAETPNGAAGNIGIVCRGTKISVDNLIIKELEGTVEIPEFKSSDIYVPQTGYVNAPAAIAVPQGSDSATYDLQGERPAVAVVKTDASLNASTLSGTALGDAAALAERWQAGVIPAFYVEDREGAQAAAEYFASENYADSFIVVSEENAAILAEARELSRLSRGVIDFSQNNDISVEEIAETVWINNANVAIVPDSFTAEETARLRARLVTVWKYAEAESFYDTIYSGVNGILTADWAALYDVYEAQTEKTITRKTLVSGHRGTAGSYPENTLEGFERAYRAGADLFELDIYLSVDNEVVVMHDSTVDRTTDGSGKIEEMTLSQIKELTVDQYGGIQETVPTLSEVYRQFADRDVVIQIEIKSGKEEIVPALKQLTERMGMENKIVVFSSNFAQMKLVREQMPSVPAAVFVNDDLSGEGDYIELQRMAAPNNYQVSRDWGDINADFDYMYKISARGMLSFMHTINTQSVYDDFTVNLGADCILSDHPEWGTDFAHQIEAIPQTAEKGEPFTPKAMLNGSLVLVDCGMERTDGKELRTDSDGKYILEESAEVVYFYEYVRIADYGTDKAELRYRVYSRPVWLNVG